MLKTFNLFLLMILSLSHNHTSMSDDPSDGLPVYEAYETESFDEDDWFDWSWEESDTEDNFYLE